MTPKQWSTAMASVVGMMPRPAKASSIQYPTCPDRAEPHVIDPTVSCPTNSPPYVTTHRTAWPCLASRRMARTIAMYGPRLDR